MILCRCGCYKEIIIKKHHRYVGIPEYIHGHNRLCVDKWISENQGKYFCQCGCNKEIIIKSRHRYHGISMYIRGHFIRTEESKKKMSESHRGKKYTEESKKKMSESHRGKKCYWFGKYGVNHATYRGGITPLNKIIRTCDKYYVWRLQIFDRDNFICQCCGIRGTYLEAHHIKTLNDIIREYNIKDIMDVLNCEILWNLNNGITYCLSCHNKLKNKGGLL